MKTFKDRTGAEWNLDLNLGTVLKIEGYDFAQALRKTEPTYISFFPPQENLFTEIVAHPNVCFTIVWLCAEEQAKQQGINNILEFAQRFDGESIGKARVALYEELPSFFPDQATLLRDLIDKFLLIQQIAAEKVKGILDRKVTQEVLERQIDKEMKKLEEELDQAIKE